VRLKTTIKAAHQQVFTAICKVAYCTMFFPRSAHVFNQNDFRGKTVPY